LSKIRERKKGDLGNHKGEKKRGEKGTQLEERRKMVERRC